MKLRGHLLICLIVLGILLDLAISGVLYRQNTQIQSNQSSISMQQQASSCWNRVLVVALHDHLTVPQRAALVKEATHCASLTR